ncbi:MAG: hypothetical protein ABI364_01775 [Caldimonas sp.]
MFRTLAATLLCVTSTASLAAGPDICAIVPVATVAGIVHQPLSGTRPDVSEAAHAYGCSYGAATPHVSISVIRPGGAAAFESTRRRLTKAQAVTGIGDRAVYDEETGLIVLFGDTAIAAFVPPATAASEQRLSMEKQLATAARSKL